MSAGVRVMADNSMTFTNRSRWSVRVVFEQDGTPLFCAVDVATLQGYQAPRRAVDSARKKGWVTEKRLIEFVGEKKRGVVSTYCCTAENAVKILEVKPRMTEAARWFVNTVIPEAEEIGQKKAAEMTMPPEPPQDPTAKAETSQETTTPSGETMTGAAASVAARLDAIILECALLKRELCHPNQ